MSDAFDFSKKSNPVLHAANYYNIPHDLAYNLADMIMRCTKNTPKGEFVQLNPVTEHHRLAEVKSQEIFVIGDPKEIEDLVCFITSVRMTMVKIHHP